MTGRTVDPRRTFGPAVLLGLCSGALAAVASSKDWLSVSLGTLSDAAGDGAPAGLPPLPGRDAVTQMPLAAALSLVVLACWGVLLVTRARVRRAVAALAALAAAGLVATVVVGGLTLPERAREEHPVADVAFTGWFWAAAVASVLALAASALAVRLAPAWPEMGSRYDAPAGGQGSGPGARPIAEQSNLDLWKRLDEGDDPTA